MFITALFTIAKTWKQPKYPSTDNWFKKMWYTYTMDYYSATKKNEILSFATTWMDLEIIILSEVSQTEKDKYHITYTWNLKNNTNESIYKTETDSQTWKASLWLPKGKGGGRGVGRINQEYGIHRYKLLHIKQISNKDLLQSTGNSIQNLVITYNGKESEKKNITESLCCIPKTNTIL